MLSRSAIERQRPPTPSAGDLADGAMRLAGSGRAPRPVSPSSFRRVPDRRSGRLVVTSWRPTLLLDDLTCCPTCQSCGAPDAGDLVIYHHLQAGGLRRR